MTNSTDSQATFDLYRRGVELLADADFEAAATSLAEAAQRAPEKASVREALGRAYFRSGRYAEAATEFEAVVETHPVDDHAHFCLGRSLVLSGDPERARHHLALAANLQPQRDDYRFYRDRLGVS